MISAYTWVLVKPGSARIRFMLVEGLVLRLERATGDAWSIAWVYYARPDRVRKRALTETSHREAWGYTLKKGSLLGQWTDADPGALHIEATSGAKIGPLLQELLDGSWEAL